LLYMNIYKQLPDFNLQINLSLGSEIVAVLGPSGAGKTTLLHCLAGLRKPEKGEIVLNERLLFSSTKRVNLPPRQRQMGYVFQSYALFPHLTVQKNVLYGVAVNRKARKSHLEAGEVLRLLKIEHLAGRYPGQISGGEKQRVALARALLTAPQALLLDEPLSALDRETRTKLRSGLKLLHQRWKIPFLLVTHDSEDAQALADRMVVLKNGLVQEELPGKTADGLINQEPAKALTRVGFYVKPPEFY